MSLFLFSAPSIEAEVNLPVPYIQQPPGGTCLPTCLTMTLHYLGREELTDEVIYKFHERTQYNRYNVPDILKDYGLYGLPSWYELGWTRETVERQLDRGRPVILGCNQGPGGHFILAVGYTDDGRVIINDPSPARPGYTLGGDHHTVEWEDVLWRGGIIVDPDPEILETAMVAAQFTKYEMPQRMKPGEVAEATIVVKNSGKLPWPRTLYLTAMKVSAPVQPDSESKVKESEFYTDEWISPSRVAKWEGRSIIPGETARFSFMLKAPQVERATVLRAHFGLMDEEGNWVTEGWLGGGDNWRLPFIAIEPKGNWALPLVEEPVDGNPSLPWEVKFGKLKLDDETVSAPPTGSPVLQLNTPERAFDTAWVGGPDWADYRVEAWIYCDYREDEKEDVLERLGLFIRNNGHHAAGNKDQEALDGCIAMTYDSDDGYLRAGWTTPTGGMDDYRSERYTIKESGWHKFAIECQGEEIRFELDGEEFHTATEKEIKHGDCGVFVNGGYKKAGTDRGLRFADFRASKLK